MRTSIAKLISDEPLRRRIINSMKDGRLFIYPTDTVYGLGCNAENESAVKKIREIKGTEHPFSVIAPSKTWIKEKLMVPERSYLDKLPGAYTLIFKKREESYLPAASAGSIGVRIPDHPVSGLVRDAGVPFITTSANLTGQPTISRVEDIPESMLEKIDFVIGGGELKGKPSQVIDLTGKKPIMIRR